MLNRQPIYKQTSQSSIILQREDVNKMLFSLFVIRYVLQINLPTAKHCLYLPAWRPFS